MDDLKHGRLAGLLEQGWIHDICCTELIALQITFIGQARCALHNGLNGRKAGVLSQLRQEFQAVEGIQRIGKQALGTIRFCSDRLDQIDRFSLLLQLRNQTLAQKIAQLTSQGLRLDGKRRQHLRPMASGLVKQ